MLKFSSKWIKCERNGGKLYAKWIDLLCDKRKQGETLQSVPFILVRVITNCFGNGLKCLQSSSHFSLQFPLVKWCISECTIKFHVSCVLPNLSLFCKCALSTIVVMQNRSGINECDIYFESKVLLALDVRYNLLFHEVFHTHTHSWCHTIHFILFNIISFRAILFTVHCSVRAIGKLYFYIFHPHVLVHSLFSPLYFLLIWIDWLWLIQRWFHVLQLDINDSRGHSLSLYQSLELIL